MIRSLIASVSLRSSLLSVLKSKAEDILTPGTLNLTYPSYYLRSICSMDFKYKNRAFKKSPELFRDTTSEDFDNERQYDFCSL